MLGAGLDTRAARLAKAGVRFFEVDHPESQKLKRASSPQLERYPIDAATYVACDFEHDRLPRRALCGRRLSRRLTPRSSSGRASRRTSPRPQCARPLRRIATVRAPRRELDCRVRPPASQKIVSGELRDAKDARVARLRRGHGRAASLRRRRRSAAPLRGGLPPGAGRSPSTRSVLSSSRARTSASEHVRLFQRLVLASVAAPDLESVP